MKRLSILALILIGGCTPKEQPLTNMIPRPSPDEATPTGIAYLCDGRKEVSVVYAKNRASVTMGEGSRTRKDACWSSRSSMPLRPKVIFADMAWRSRSGSMGGLVTSAKRCLK